MKQKQLTWIEYKWKKLNLVKILPNSGDTLYCGSIVENSKLFLSYYSQHELNLKESKGGENASGIYLLGYYFIIKEFNYFPNPPRRWA